MTLQIGASASPAAMVGSLWQNRSLIVQLTRREVISRYRGSVIGLAWSFFNPLLMLAVYTFFFSVVFRSRWGGEGAGKAEFAAFLFAGIIVHGVFAECINRAPTLILGNVNYVKRVVFPLEILPWVAMGSALFHALVSLLVLLLAQAVLSHHLSWSALYFPIIMVPLIVMTMGIAWMLAAVGVFVRDIGQITAVLTTVLLFLSPVFYPVSNMPERYRPWINSNPLTFIIEQSRTVLLLDGSPDWGGVVKYSLIAVVVAAIGFWIFQKMRRGFADVL
ncbi:ABC transporter permease [Lysobacter tyrosinilyticus]